MSLHSRFAMSEYLTEEELAYEAKIKELMGRLEAAMQEKETMVAARRLYHEAPDDVFELIVMLLSDLNEDGWVKGGLNVLRLVSKRCMQVVESVATRLTGKGAVNSISAAVKRCKRIEQIRCNSSLRSLEGCPDGLKSLYIDYGSNLESLEPGAWSLYRHARSWSLLRFVQPIRYLTFPPYPRA